MSVSVLIALVAGIVLGALSVRGLRGSATPAEHGAAGVERAPSGSPPDADKRVLPAWAQSLSSSRDTPHERAAREIHRNAVQSCLLGHVSERFHDTFLSIRRITDAILGSVPEGTQLWLDAQHVRRSSERAGEVAERLAALASLVEAEPSEVDVAEEMRGIARLVDLLSPSNVTVRASIDPGARFAIVDRSNLRHVVLGVCCEVMEALSDGGGSISVSCATREGSGSAQPSAGAVRRLELTIRGEATRFSVDGAARGAAEPGLHSPASSPALDAVARHITESVSGVVSLGYEEGGQLRASFAFPLARVSDEASDGSDAEAGEPASDEGAPLILVVDDNAMVISTMQEILDSVGYRVVTQPDGREALAYLESRGAEVDLVLSDVRMPGMSGLELAREVTARFPELPIILMTAFTEVVNLEEARELGVNDLLLKPVEMDDLLYAIKKHLEAGALPESA